jgi:hypothetical protein
LYCFFIGYHNYIYSTYIPDGTSALKKEKIDNEELNIELKPGDEKDDIEQHPARFDLTPSNLIQNTVTRLGFILLSKKENKRHDIYEIQENNENYYIDVK